MTLGIDFTSQDFFRDPSAAFEKLRAAGPVVEVKLPMIGQVWTTTTQEMASRVLKDNHVFTLRRDDGGVAGMRWWMPSIFRVFAKNMLTVDEPDHSRLRGIVEEAFRRRAVIDMAPRIHAIAGQLAEPEHRARLYVELLCRDGHRQGAAFLVAGGRLRGDERSRRHHNYRNVGGDEL